MRYVNNGAHLAQFGLLSNNKAETLEESFNAPITPIIIAKKENKAYTKPFLKPL